MRKTPVRLLLVLTVLTVLSGCATGARTILHPIEKTDIYRMNAGGSFTPEKDGYFVSDFYVLEVLAAKVELAKKKV